MVLSFWGEQVGEGGPSVAKNAAFGNENVSVQVRKYSWATVAEQGTSEKNISARQAPRQKQTRRDQSDLPRGPDCPAYELLFAEDKPATQTCNSTLVTLLERRRLLEQLLVPGLRRLRVQSASVLKLYEASRKRTMKGKIDYPRQGSNLRPFAPEAQ